jgi:Flp pilus assembly protein TadG
MLRCLSDRRRPKGQRGSALVEAAIVTPLLLLLLAGVADFGRAYFSYIAIINASREGARSAAKLPCYSAGTYKAAILQVTKQAAATNSGTGNNIILSDVKVTTNFSSCPSRGAAVRVTVTYPFSTVLGSIVGSETIALQASTEMSRIGQD